MKFSVLFLFSAIFSSAAASTVIDKWGRCKITDSNISECLSKAIANMIVDLKQGNAEYGIPPWEPLMVKRFDLKSGGKGPVNLHLDMYDLAFANITDFTKVSVDASELKDKILKLSLLIPFVNVTGKYKMNGKLLAVPIKGAGDVTLHFIKSKADFVAQGKLHDKNGKSYWNIDEFTAVIRPISMHLEFTNLFNGDKKLGDATNKIMNENWKLVIKEFEPYISSEFGNAVMPLANMITHVESFDEMFPK